MACKGRSTKSAIINAETSAFRLADRDVEELGPYTSSQAASKKKPLVAARALKPADCET